MSNLVYQYKYSILSFLLIVMLISVLGSCEKTEFQETGTSTTGMLTWKRVTKKGMNDFAAIETYDGRIYFCGEIQGTLDGYPVDVTQDTYQRLYSYSPLDGIRGEIKGTSNSNFSPYPFFQGMVKEGDYIYLYGGLLYNAPNIQHRGIVRFNLNTKIVEGVGFLSSTSSIPNMAVFDMVDYNSNLVLCGNFTTATFPTLSTDYLNTIQGNQAMGLYNAPTFIRDMCVHDGKLYTAGEDAYLLAYDGSNWNQETYNSLVLNDQLLAVESFNGELYLLGEFATGGFKLKKRDIAGNWSDVLGFTASSLSNFPKMKVVDGKLYFFGGQFEINGINDNHLSVRFDGSNWESFSVGNVSAKDVTELDGKLYVATGEGIFAEQ